MVNSHAPGVAVMTTAIYALPDCSDASPITASTPIISRPALRCAFNHHIPGLGMSSSGPAGGVAHRSSAAVPGQRIGQGKWEIERLGGLLGAPRG